MSTTYPIPDNESERLRALRSYAILDTDTEEEYDDFTFLASRICKVPIALISLIDEDRQWFKSKVGIDASETPRELAFCAHAIMNDELFIVEDALLDKRFSENALVVNDPKIRFYAGVPLINHDGMALGTLCAIDHKPRALSEDQLQALSALSRQLMSLFRLRLTSQDLADALQKIKVMDGLIPICAHCKDIRQDDDFWQTLEEYLAEHSDVDLTHGLCPDCVREHYGRLMSEEDLSKVKPKKTRISQRPPPIIDLQE